MIPDRSFHRELSSQSIMDTSFSPNTQPSKSASIINHKFIPLNDMNNAQSSELTPPKLDSTSQKTTSSTRKTTFVAKDQNNETTFISSDQNKNTHTPSSDQKTSKKQIINSTQSFEGEKKDSLEQSSPYTSKVVQRVYSVSTSSNSSPMLSALSNIRLRSNFTTDTVITNPPTPIAAGSNKVFYSMNDRISKDIAELEHSKKQPHSEGSTLVEEFNVSE